MSDGNLFDLATGTRSPLPASVFDVFSRNKRLKNYFHGKGQRNGTPQQTYDLEMVVGLITAGVDDDVDLRQAVRLRPHHMTAPPADDYLEQVLAAAWDAHRLNEVEEQRKADAKAKRNQPVLVDRVVVLMVQGDPTYRFTVGDVVFDMPGDVLAKKDAFAVRYMNAVGCYPPIPSKAEDWRDQVNAFLARAERIAMPASASEEFFERQVVEEIIAGAPRGTTLAEFKQGFVVTHPTEQVPMLSSVPLLKNVRTQIPKMTAPRLANLLRDLGWDGGKRWLENVTVHAWTGPLTRVEESPAVVSVDTRG